MYCCYMLKWPSLVGKYDVDGHCDDAKCSQGTSCPAQEVAIGTCQASLSNKSKLSFSGRFCDLSALAQHLRNLALIATVRISFT